MSDDDKTPEEDIKSTVSSIEHELYKYFGDTNNKYKLKYRSLIFNIKDVKNKVSRPPIAIRYPISGSSIYGQ